MGKKRGQDQKVEKGKLLLKSCVFLPTRKKIKVNVGRRSREKSGFHLGNCVMDVYVIRSTLNNYMLWHLSKWTAAYLSKPFRDAKKEFSEVLSGNSSRCLKASRTCYFSPNHISGDGAEHIARRFSRVCLSFKFFSDMKKV